MFGHLSAEDFTNLLEGTPLPDRRRDHWKSCPRCVKTFEAVQKMRHQVEGMKIEADEYIPEPDWSEFRSDVRNALLSRSVKRENAGRRWLGGLGLKPAMAMGFSFVLIFGLTLSGVLWYQVHQQEIDSTTIAVAADDPVTEETEMNSLTSMSRGDVFDDLLHLNADEADSLQMILEDMASKGVTSQ